MIACERCGTTERETQHSEELGVTHCGPCFAVAADTSGLLTDIRTFVRRFVVLTDDQACAVSLWVAHTWAIDFAYCTPYLNVHSPEKRSGKTRLLEVLDTIVATPWLTGGTSKAALVRKIDAAAPTLLLDESDAAFGGDAEYAEALRGVLNNGYTRGKPYTTCIGQGAGIKPYDFKVFSPKAIAGIGKLPDTVADRSIPIALKRRAPGEYVERFRRRRAEAQGAEIANALHQLRETDGFATLDGAEPELPDELGDRAQDVWEPLFAIADLAGGFWATQARAAAIRLSAEADPEDESFGVRLLADCRLAFGDEAEQIPTNDLVAYLNALEEAPWQGWGKKRSEPGLTARDLASLLRPYKVRSTDIHVGEGADRRTLRGYRRDDFKDAWNRYLPFSGGSIRAKHAIGSNKPDSGVFHPRQKGSVARIENAQKPLEQADGADGADKHPVEGGGQRPNSEQAMRDDGHRPDPGAGGMMRYPATPGEFDRLIDFLEPVPVSAIRRSRGWSSSRSPPARPVRGRCGAVTHGSWSRIGSPTSAVFPKKPVRPWKPNWTWMPSGPLNRPRPQTTRRSRRCCASFAGRVNERSSGRAGAPGGRARTHRRGVRERVPERRPERRPRTPAPGADRRDLTDQGSARRRSRRSPSRSRSATSRDRGGSPTRRGLGGSARSTLQLRGMGARSWCP